jgi:monoamine oxidase
MARAPIAGFLQELFRDYARSERSGKSVQQVREERLEATITRRDLIKAGAAAAGVVALGGPLALKDSLRASAGVTPRIAIIGAGIAGLNAALTLQDGNAPKVGAFASTIYEAADFVGGRMHSRQAPWVNGQISEHCGELIDTNHTAIMNLANRFGLPLTDLYASQPPGAPLKTYFFNGSYYPQSQAVSDFGPVYSALQADLKAIGASDHGVVTFNNFNAAAKALDNMSNVQWIDSRVPGGHSSALGQLIDVGYLTEFGRDSGDQSALNIVTFLGFQPKPVQFDIFGTSDERFHITGGNQLLPIAMANLLTTRSPQCTINLSTRLQRIARNPDGTFSLTFTQGTTGSSTFTTVADRVIMTVPFSVLRGLDFSAAGFDTQKTLAIDNLGYGTNTKLHLQFNSRLWNQPGPWGANGSTGYTFADTGFQNCWDVSRGQALPQGILVDYTGGSVGTSFTSDTAPALAGYAGTFLKQVEHVFPGISATYNGIATLDTPWRNPNLLGSYSCLRVGQYTTIFGSEKLRQGNCHFAGEHCSINFQGFMEGGAEEGGRAAQEIQGDYAAGIFP